MVKRIGVEDNELTFEQAAEILKTVDEAIGDDFLSYENFKKYKKAHPEQNIPGDTIIKNALGAKTWNEAKQNAGLEVLPHTKEASISNKAPNLGALCIVASPRS